ncbi:hypothetical protein [Iningainema tapete]|uniref:hypothetical protein n=1 Tax=Iningainema tapete TaxID=2806730 RepID=UPI001EE2834B|nr:hypothetical protein [Iningainema tapete]
MTRKVIAAIIQANPPNNSTAGEFLTILKSNNPLQILKVGFKFIETLSLKN